MSYYSHIVLPLDLTEITNGSRLIKFIAIDKSPNEADYTIEIHGFYDETHQKFYITNQIICTGEER